MFLSQRTAPTGTGDDAAGDPSINTLLTERQHAHLDVPVLVTAFLYVGSATASAVRRGHQRVELLPFPAVAAPTETVAQYLVLNSAIWEAHRDRHQPAVVELNAACGPAHLVDLHLVVMLSALQPVNGSLVRADRRQLVAQHAQREQAEQDALHHQEDHEQLVATGGVALVASAYT